MRYRELPPDAGRVIESLRDSGYDFCTAVADIVDNSIAAGAGIVRVAASCDQKTGKIRVSIADNGSGMDPDELGNAMTYGSARREDEHSLGKFGLGLKTASTSQCRKVTVVSRKGGAESKLCLDIDHAGRTGRWEYLEDLPTGHEVSSLDLAAKGGPGTVVIWEECDRLMGRSYKRPGGTQHQNAFKAKVDDLRFHLGMVFQRFLDVNDARARNVRVFLNGNGVEAYDPFALGTGKTALPFHGTWRPDEEGPCVTVNSYVVPSRDELGLSAAEAVFPDGINPDDMQGLFIYRENRLIHWGDWCGLYKKEFHQRLCRVELSFDASLDDEFSVDFQKSKVAIDASIAEWLKSTALPEARSQADERYRNSSAKASVKREFVEFNHAPSNKSIAQQIKGDTERKFSVRPAGEGRREIKSEKGRRFVEAIPDAANSDMLTSIRLEDSLPNGALWRAGLYNREGVPRTYVEINTGHEFYRRAYYACGENRNAMKCLDYLIWSLAQAEYATKDEGSMEHYEDMIIEVSRTLRELAAGLPENGGE